MRPNLCRTSPPAFRTPATKDPCASSSYGAPLPNQTRTLAGRAHVEFTTHVGPGGAAWANGDAGDGDLPFPTTTGPQAPTPAPAGTDAPTGHPQYCGAGIAPSMTSDALPAASCNVLVDRCAYLWVTEGLE